MEKDWSKMRVSIEKEPGYFPKLTKGSSTHGGKERKGGFEGEGV